MFGIESLSVHAIKYPLVSQSGPKLSVLKVLYGWSWVRSPGLSIQLNVLKLCYSFNLVIYSHLIQLNFCRFLRWSWLCPHEQGKNQQFFFFFSSQGCEAHEFQRNCTYFVNISLLFFWQVWGESAEVCFLTGQCADVMRVGR